MRIEDYEKWRERKKVDNERDGETWVKGMIIRSGERKKGG